MASLVALETDLYELLGVSPDASQGSSRGILVSRFALNHLIDDIKKAYKRKVLTTALSLFTSIDPL